MKQLRSRRGNVQNFDRQRLAKLIATVILAIVSALFGHNQFNKNSKNTPLADEIRGAGRR